MEHRENIDAVQRMQNYIDANIRSPITLNDLAKAAGYSRGSARLFRAHQRPLSDHSGVALSWPPNAKWPPTDRRCRFRFCV